MNQDCNERRFNRERAIPCATHGGGGSDSYSHEKTLWNKEQNRIKYFEQLPEEEKELIRKGVKSLQDERERDD